MWYQSIRSDTRPECGSTCIDKQWIKYMHTDYYFSFWNVITRTCFWAKTAGMERLEEYVDEESSFNEKSNSRREPVQEEITNNSLELLQTIKELRTEMETVKKENERILRAKEDLNQILLEKF